MSLLIGAHLKNNENLLKSIKEIIKIGGNSIQIFTGPPNSLHQGKIFKYSDEEIKKIIKFKEDNKIKIYIHAKYILNFSKPLLPKNKIFLVRFVQDLDFSKKIKSNGVILHFGTASNNLTKIEARNNMIKSLISCLDHADLKSIPILETSSGEGNYIGKTIDDMKNIVDKLPNKYKKRIKFCIDTCHIFVSGYPIHKDKGFKNYIKEFDEKIGINKIALIHLNDSKTKFNMKNDRHEEIGKGYIFDEKKGGNMNTLKDIIKFSKKEKIPLILETHNNFKKQIDLIKNIYIKKKGGNNINLKKLIINFEELMDIHKALGNIHQFQVYKNSINKLKKINNLNDINKLNDFGKGTKLKIDEFFNTGKILVLENFKKDKKIMALVNLQKIYGIGPKKANELIKDGIYNISDLKLSIKKNKIILNNLQLIGVKYFNELQKKINKKDADNILKYLENFFNKNCENYQLYLMGGFRIGKTEGKDIDIIITTKNNINNNIDLIYKLLYNNNFILETISKGSVSLTLLLKLPIYNNIFHIDFKICEDKYKAHFMLYFGSGENFSRKIRKIAKEKGYKLNEYGIKNLKTNKNIIFKTEKEIFKFLKLDYLNPKNRL